MKYSPSHYAEALYGALSGKSPEERNKVARSFVGVIQKNRDSNLVSRILERYEKIYLKKEGLRKVDIESVDPISGKVKGEIEDALGSKIVFTEKINPKLIAGISLLIDDSTYVDASARAVINRIYNPTSLL